MLSCILSADDPASDRSGQHTPRNMCHRGSCRPHLPVVVVGCGPLGSPVFAVGCDVGENRSGSPDQPYVGQTCRTLDHRLKEHKRAITSGNLAQSAVAEHAAHESHVIDWKEAKVVDTHPRYHQRCALESWHIRSETTTMNRDDGSLPQAYNTLLNYPRKPHTPH